MCVTRARTFLTIVFLSLLTEECRSFCSNVYGAEPCTYLPAPPGKTPPCAHPGLTYCEYPENYPGQRIKYLIQKWRFDYSTLLRDETRDEFSTYFYPPPIYKYGHYGPGNNIKPDSYYPEPIHIPKPPYTFDESHRTGNAYIPPKGAQPYNYTAAGLTGYPDSKTQQVNGATQFTQYKYAMDIPAATVSQTGQLPTEIFGPIQNLYPSLALPYVSYPYANKIWNRKDGQYGKSVLVRKRRSDKVRDNIRKLSTLHSYDFQSNHTIVRRKRQSALIGRTLCESRSQFIMPRAALNNKGNWMYVVNMPELDNRYSQLVKSETCVSQTCDAACGLPLGYTSRCEQKYVQKRLIALEGAGNELYTDVFWFPSCCVCTLTNS